MDAVLAARNPALIPDSDLAEAQRLFEQTTQGEWWANVHAQVFPANDREAKGNAIAECGLPDCDDDAAWIAAAHNLWPRLVARAQATDAVWNKAIEIVRGISTGYYHPRTAVAFKAAAITTLEAARDAKEKSDA